MHRQTFPQEFCPLGLVSSNAYIHLYCCFLREHNLPHLQEDFTLPTALQLLLLSVGGIRRVLFGKFPKRVLCLPLFRPTHCTRALNTITGPCWLAFVQPGVRRVHSYYE